MSSYDTEHNITHPDAQTSTYRRPDLSSFFSALETLQPTSSLQSNPHSTSSHHPQATPGDISTLFRQYTQGLQSMLLSSTTPGLIPSSTAEPQTSPNPLLEEMISRMMQLSDDPPSQINGMPDTYVDGLDRVPKKQLKADDACPICTNAFLEDKYPLVVEVPCGGRHRFDAECLAPWLKVQTTCPMCRTDLARRKEVVPVVEDDEESDDGGMYG